MAVDNVGFLRAQDVVREATRLGITVGTAESCTGGLVCGALTDVAGSSAVVRGSIVSYDPAVKRSVLGVTRRVCDEPWLGVVSESCARMMARGARRVLGSDVAVSITGIAGPGGAEPSKPVGTVWFGIDSAFGTHGVRRLFLGNRCDVREAAVRVALELVLGEIARFKGVATASGNSRCGLPWTNAGQDCKG
ncbi:MAG: CinA family protein [Atopobiaceae bacterium]|nr:CinA family protein [Atopobiaceae bacterium]